MKPPVYMMTVWTHTIGNYKMLHVNVTRLMLKRCF